MQMPQQPELPRRPPEQTESAGSERMESSCGRAVRRSRCRSGGSHSNVSIVSDASHVSHVGSVGNGERHRCSRKQRWRRHRWGLASWTSTMLTSSMMPALLLAATLSFFLPLAAGQSSDSNTTVTQEPCTIPLANSGRYTVSRTAQAVELATALASCTGGAYNVTWTGAVTLSAPLVIAADSSLTIRGVEGAGGEAAVMNGNNVTGIVNLGERSSLSLEGVSLQNAWRASGNGGAIRAEAAGCRVTAVNSRFESNNAAAAGFEEGRGGAIALGGGAVAELENCTIVGNRAGVSGGGVSTKGGQCSVLLRGCTLERNEAEIVGGAVVLEGRSTVTFAESTVSNNVAGDEGGGIYGVNSTVLVRAGSLFLNNTVYRAGGGISLHEESSLNITDSEFVENLCLSDGEFLYGTGGAIRVQGNTPNSRASVHVADSVFEGNAAPSGGALFVAYGFDLVVERTDFTNNVAWFAGGVAMGGAADIGVDGDATFSACNFTGGWGSSGGGGLAIEDCQVSMSDCLFESNSGSFEGGALYLQEDAAVTLKRSTFRGNYIDIGQTGGGSGGGISARGATLSAMECLFVDNQAGYEANSLNNNGELLGGGAVLLEGLSNASFSGCNFTRNGGAAGGAILARDSSSANVTNSHMAFNKANLHGGALSCEESSSCGIGYSYVGGNVANMSGGGVFVHFSSGDVVNVTFDSNVVSAGSGGAVHLSSASNVTIRGGQFSANSASSSGGHILVTGSGTSLDVRGPVAFARGAAEVNGGAIHASDAATLTMFNAEIRGNRAEGNGGGLSALGAGNIRLEACNISGNGCGISGGGVSVVGTRLFAKGTDFDGNEAISHGGGLRGYTGANMEVEDCLFNGNSAQMGGGISSLNGQLLARRCDVRNNAAARDGGGLRLSYETTAVLNACHVSSNTAGFDGGGVAIDASSDATDGSLSATNASSTFLCEGSGTFTRNNAADRGGAVYVTRRSTVEWEGCTSSRNTANFGAAVYASHSDVVLSGGSTFAYDEAPTGAMIQAIQTNLEANNATLLAQDVPAMIAVLMTQGSTMKAFRCSFSGWTGTEVVLTGGLLEMDMCDFRGSSADLLVSVTNDSAPARIRNTALGLESYASLASGEDTMLSTNVQTCATDPCGAAAVQAVQGGSDTSDPAEFVNQACVEGNLGVYCPCFEATITGKKECLGNTSTVKLAAPDQSLIATGVNGTIESTLNVTAGGEGGMVVWQVEEKETTFSKKGLTWNIVPNVGILEAGASASIEITGRLTATLNGLTRAQFKAVSFGSQESTLAMVNTTFYYCIEGTFFSEEECKDCDSINLPEGLDCNEPGVLISTLPIANGYWRARNDTITVRECLYDSACEGGSVFVSSNDYCAIGYEGPYCAVCCEGYAGGIANGCHRCSEAFKAGMYFLLAVGAALVLLFFHLAFRYLVQSPAATSQLLSCRNHRVVTKARQLPLYKLKIPIVVFQILTQYADITTVDFPSSFTKFLSYLDFFNLDVGWLFSASCVVSLDFYGRLVWTTAVPLVLLAALGCTYLYARSRVMTAGLPKANEIGRRPRAEEGMSESRQLSVVKRRHMAALVTVSFLLYSTVSTIVFQTFACDHIEELDETYLRADYSLMCNTAKHDWFKIYAGIMILVYPVGIPLFYSSLLFRHRHRIYPKQALRDGVSAQRRLVDKKIAHTVLLWEAYRPSRFYYEVIECARRLLLTGCLVFILPNSAGQASVACVLSVVSVCMFITLRPFADRNDDRLYVLGCVVIFLSMFMSLVPKVHVADGDNQSQAILSWLLIFLSVVLAGMAVADCFWEVRAIGGAATSQRQLEPQTGSVAGHLMDSRRGGHGGGEEKFDNGSGSKNSSPEDRNTDNPSSSDLYEFVNEIDGSGGSLEKGRVMGSGGVPRENRLLSNPGSHLHPSGSSAGGSRLATGYAEPVPQPLEGGIGEGTGGGGPGSSMLYSSTSNVSHGSGNTYGPLAESTVISNGSAPVGGGVSQMNKGAGKFPPIHPYDEDATTSSATGGEAYGRRTRDGRGVRGGGVRRDRSGSGPSSRSRGGGTEAGRRRNDSQEARISPSPRAASNSGSSAGPFRTNSRDNIIYRGFDEHGGRDRRGPGALRLSPAEPMTNAFPAPMTNAFPESTDTPESEQPGSGPGQRTRGGAITGLSPSPASSQLTFVSGDSRRQLLGPSPAASEYMLTVSCEDEGHGTSGARSASGEQRLRVGGSEDIASGVKDGKSKWRGGRRSGGR